jgi:hypothetical protein
MLIEHAIISWLPPIMGLANTFAISEQCSDYHSGWGSAPTSDQRQQRVDCASLCSMRVDVVLSRIQISAVLRLECSISVFFLDFGFCRPLFDQ